MPFCPECKYEFESGIKKCPDCGTKLVSRLPEEHEVEVKWVLLKNFTSPVQAEMVQEALAQNDIQSFIKSDLFHDTFATHATSMAGSYAKLYVAENELKAAQEIAAQVTSEAE